MHVLILPSSYPRFYKPLSGVFFRDQALALRNAGAIVGVIDPAPRGAGSLAYGGLSVHHFQVSQSVEGGIPAYHSHDWCLPRAKRLFGRQFVWRAGDLYNRYVREHGRPDIIHAHDLMWGGVAARVLARREGIPYVATAHSAAYGMSLIREWEEPLLRAVGREASALVAVSHSLAASLKRYCAVDHPRVIPNVVDTDFFAPRPEGPRGAGFQFACVASLLRDKGYDTLLRAFASAYATTPDVRLEIGGEGPDGNQFRALAQELGISKQVSWLGALTREEVRACLHRADAFVLPSQFETFGVVFIEAMSTGLPVVASKCGGPEDFVDDGCGYLVENGSVEQTAGAMCRMVEARDEWRSRGPAIRKQAVARFGQAVVAGALLQVYQDVLQIDAPLAPPSGAAAIATAVRRGQRAAGYRICAACIMDTSDPDIVFDEAGVCNHCHRYRASLRSEKYLRRIEPGALDALVREIRKHGRGRKYDCIIGVSGGADSTYVACQVKELGLRPLAVHLDNGWNSELAVSNIERTLNRLGIDLYTHVIDWREFSDLQRSFLRASTPELEVPTDHAILATLYAVAAREGVRHVLSGHNTATEGGGVGAWIEGHGDWHYIRTIHRRFGSVRLRTYPHYGVARFLYYSLLKRVQWVQILDFMEYRKEDAVRYLQDKLEWRDYGGKHFESIFTRFYLGFYLPEKFGFEVKRLHLSSIIWSGQRTREAALLEMSADDYPVELQERDREYVVKKLGLTDSEFQAFLNQPRKAFGDYPSYKRFFRHIRPLMVLYHALKRR